MLPKTILGEHQEVASASSQRGFPILLSQLNLYSWLNDYQIDD